ncbi:MAG TPA: MFS transporter [Dongiaceae bacterium]
MGDIADTQRGLTSARLFSLGAAIACTSIMGMTTGLAWTLLSLRLEHRGFDAASIGVNAAAQSLGILAAGLFAPWAIARIGFVRGCGAAVAGAIVMMLLLPLFDSYAAWLLLRFLLGVSSCFLFIAGESWIVLIAPPRYLGRVVGILGLVWGGTFALGPIIVGIVGIGGWTPFLVGAAAAFCAGLPLFFVGSVPVPAQARRPPNIIAVLRRSPGPLIAVALLGLVESSHDSLLPVYGVRLGMDVPMAVLLVTSVLLGLTLIQLPIGWIADHMDRWRLLLIATLSGLSLTLAFSVTAMTVLQWPILFLLGASVGSVWAVSLALIGDEFDAEHVAGANAVRAILYGGAGMAGPLISGAAMDLWVPHGLIAALALMWLVYLPFAARRR